jgi:hypothetical protein
MVCQLIQALTNLTNVRLIQKHTKVRRKTEEFENNDSVKENCGNHKENQKRATKSDKRKLSKSVRNTQHPYNLGTGKESYVHGK